MEKDSPIFKIRHSLAHVMAHAVKDLYPHVEFATGPATETGFYYDFDFGTGESPGEQNLPKIEKRMREILKRGFTPTQEKLDPDAALLRFKDARYKAEVLQKKIEEGAEKISIYTIGEFIDPCSGPHVDNAKDIDPQGFKLERIAGAYWKGDEKNPMLTRIYGLAFENKEALDAYLLMMEEAKKRDHRLLGKQLDLFTFSDLVGPGLPLWTPKGTLVRHLLDNFVQELREVHGYQHVTIPHITKKDLYETSGHWEKFTTELMRIETREKKDFALKPMNCPHHTQIFDRHPHSYKDMPQRYAETTMVYRDEQSGELGGLTRVLSITQDDSHVFCRANQVKEEFFKIWDIVDTFYGAFGFQLRVRLSFHDPENMESYLGSKETWQNAEDALREIAKERNADYFEAPGEAALYGPKLDFMAKDSIGREHQVATIQLDMNLPERFDLACTNEQGEKERVVMIHCAIMGSLERFAAVLIEHLGGNFPLWLSPEQVRILTVSDKHKEYAEGVHAALKAAGIRAHLDEDAESLGKKIRNAKTEKLPYFLVIGDKEVESKNITLESRGGDSEAMSVEVLIDKLKEEIETKK